MGQLLLALLQLMLVICIDEQHRNVWLEGVYVGQNVLDMSIFYVLDRRIAGYAAADLVKRLA